jgi:hypothetical protein
MAEPGFASQFTFSLDELEASMAATRAETEAAGQVNSTPPRIIYRDHPALLVTIDGQPLLRDIEQSDYQAVINTPYPLIRDGKTFYLNVASDVWYQAPAATGPFRYSKRVPNGIEKLVGDSAAAAAESASSDEAVAETVTAANAPEIVVTTEPAELIVTDGPAAFVPLVDDLLVLNNSDNDVFLHLGEQRYYIVLAGRWYRAGTLDGPWEHREAGALPTAFANIPRDSEQADSRVYVAGTEEAQAAVLDAQVPQTAAVRRGEAAIEAQYDGEPEFASVDGTDMDYAVNSGSTVILSDGLYYLVEDGVWYVSTTANGPWQVAVARPDQVRVILPSSPVYNVKYVYVYGSTPNVVYVGYTPGYLGSYVYGPTIVYGTGWYYRPWVTRYSYYPRPYTWGFNVSYNYWYGWGFGPSWAWGPFSYSYSYSYWPGGYWHRGHHWYNRYYSYWGPRGYRSRHHHGRPPHAVPYDGRRGGRHNSQPYQRHHNLYRDVGQRAVVAETRDRVPGGYRKPGMKIPGAGQGYAKKSTALSKRRGAYERPDPVRRDELAVKARASSDGFRAAKSKAKAGKDRKPYGATHAGSASEAKAAKFPDRKVTRDELVRKVKTANASGQVKPGRQARVKNAVAPVARSKSVSRKQPVPARTTPSGRTVKATPQGQKQFTAPAGKTVVKTDRVKGGKAVTTRQAASVANSPGASSAGARAITPRSKSMPKVTLTRPQKPSYPAYGKPKAASPAHPAPKASAPARQQWRPAPPAPGHVAAPAAAAPQAKASRQSAPARSKQKAQKARRN